MNTDLGPTTEQINTMRQNILRRVAPVPSTGRSAVPRSVSTRRRIGFATLGVAALAAALVVTGVVSPFGPRGAASAQAAEFLQSAAAATIHTSDPVVGAGQYLRVATTAVDGPRVGGGAPNDWWLSPSTGVLYIPANRTGQWVWERYPIRPTVFYGNSKEAAMEYYDYSLGDAHLNSILRADGGAFYGSVPSDYGMDKMPLDPRALRDYFYDHYIGGSASKDEDVWVRITDLLRTGEVPADLRAALYQTIALIPGVDIVDNQATLDGRTGVALGRTEPARGATAAREEIVIDPQTGLLIGERTVSTVQIGDLPTGTVHRSTSVETSVVDTAP